ncbi:hypothetical protein J3E72DRAFT_388687 [Bipolaris maydis]|nr:hypothetical protein J3E72DRAFT_388687 [Bipolaris maydis]
MKSIIESISHRLSSPSRSRSKRFPISHDEPSVTEGDGTNGRGSPEDNVPLLNLDLLNIKPEDRQWFTDVNIAVRDLAKGSEDQNNYGHIRRIVSNAAHILDKEVKHHEWARKLDPIIIWVSCMVHSVSRQLYKAAEKPCDQLDVIDDFLKSYGCPLPIRRQVAFITIRVTVEIEAYDVGPMKVFSDEYPAYSVIQDAHLLGEMGAIGIVRFYTFYGTFPPERWDSTVKMGKLVEDYLSQYVQAMRTETGTNIAEERLEWMKKEFLRQWEREADTSNV